MTPKVFTGWAVATAVAVLAALVAVLGAPSVATVEIDNAPAFPALRAHPDAAVRIIVASAEERFTLRRTKDGRWVAADKFDYPADAAKIRELVAGLADLRLVEPKTRLPERYARLEVEDVDAPGAKSRRVRIEDAEGRPLAEAIIGKRRFRYTGGAPNGVYLRRPGEARAWLASGRAKVEPLLLDWLDKTVVNIARETVARVEIEPREGPAYVAARDSGEGSFRILGREDAKLNPDTDDRLAGVLAYIDFDDVKPEGEITWPEDKTTTARVTTFDGVAITLRLARIDDADWATVSASAVADAAKPDAARKRAEAIAARTKGWAYRLSEGVAARLTRPVAQLIEGAPGS